MKFFTHTLFFFLLTTQICFGQWYAQNSGTTKNLHAVHFADANNGWAVGDSGTILYTTNSGVDWVQQASGTILSIVDISFVDGNTGWVLARTGLYPNFESILLKTTNGGISWSQQIHDSLYFNAVFFIDENIGWVVGQAMLKTTDGGHIWIPDTSGQIGGRDNCGDVQFLDPLTGYVAAGENYKTTDGGDNWVEQRVGLYMEESVQSISFSDSENGYAVTHWFGNPPSIYHTTNGGVEWGRVYHPIHLGICEDVYSINSNLVYAVEFAYWPSEKGYVMRSSDAGTSWDEQFSEIDKRFGGVHFVDENIGWVVGDSGTILHTTNGGVTFIDNETTQPTEFILEQNYPNPFNPSTVISYQFPVSSEITLKVFDILGNEITTLVNEEKTIGSYEVEFNATGLPSGVYFYQLKAGGFVETKKMLLLK